jgi:hypothetical protein
MVAKALGASAAPGGAAARDVRSPPTEGDTPRSAEIEPAVIAL